MGEHKASVEVRMLGSGRPFLVECWINSIWNWSSTEWREN